jgi:hypothetical protein
LPSLNEWLYSINLTDMLIKEYFLYSALVDYFHGAKYGTHIVPNKQQIDDEEARLRKAIHDFDPEIVAPIGRLSISYCLSKGVEPLVKDIGKNL